MAMLDSFAAQPLWTTWKIEARFGGKPTKVPYSVDGRRAKSNDPSSWMTRIEAERCRATFGHEGLNIVVGQAAEQGYCLGGVDIDHCLDDDGFIAPWANDVVTLLDSYTEVSYSGTGLRVFFLYDPKLVDKNWRKHVQKPHPQGGKDTGIEVYFSGHFLAVTDGVFQDRDELAIVEKDKLVALQACMRRFDEPTPDHPVTVDEVRRLHDAVVAMDNNDLSWEEWNTRGMAIFRATNGSSAGFEAFMRWCQKSSKYVERNCRERWENWRRSPPRHVTEGTIFYWAREAGWVDDQAEARLQQYRELRRTRTPTNGHTNGFHDYSEFEPDTEHGHDIGSPAAAPKSPIFDFANAFADRWEGLEVPSLPFLVTHLMPFGMCSLVGGDSGSGKSILMQTLATCVAAGEDNHGHPFLNLATMAGKAVYVTGEDPETILHMRQDRILKALDLPWSAIKGRLIVRSMAEHDIWLYQNGRPTSIARAFQEELTAIEGLSFVAIDSAALVFDDDEIKRAPVAGFMKWLNRMAMQIKTSIAIVAHTSRSSNASTKSMVSGSTGWVAHSRSGILLETVDEAEEVKLSLIKPNYAKRGFSMDLTWSDEGVLMAKGPRDKVDDIKDDTDRKLILREVERAWIAGSPLSLDARAGDLRYLPRIMKVNHRMNAGNAERLAKAMFLKRDLVEGIKSRRHGLRIPPPDSTS